VANLQTKIGKRYYEAGFLKLPIELIKVARPIHWVKNLALFAALIFTGTLTIPSYFISVVWAFFAFNLAASSVYVFNDIRDRKKDQKHPIKKKRPVAAGKLSTTVALFYSVALAIASLYIAASLNHLFFLVVATYLLLQLFYSLGLKNIPIIDILIIAAGFIIRVYAGAFVINAHLSVWFLLTVISTALFLAAGKRRGELSTISDKARKSLSKYKRELLNSYVTMFGNAAWMSWSLFAFFESPPADLQVWLFLAEISKAITINKLLMATIPFVIFIVMRYESLIFQDRGEAPEKLFLTDIPLITAVAIYLALVLTILYGGVANI
jgi:decaprenyl-phosphate phosphoribosyltransferase